MQMTDAVFQNPQLGLPLTAKSGRSNPRCWGQQCSVSGQSSTSAVRTLESASGNFQLWIVADPAGSWQNCISLFDAINN
jgi:hypothetical protein